MMGMGMGVGFSSPSPWTPAALSPVLWQGPASAAGRVTYAAQPTIPGAGWSGASWAGSGLGPYAHTAGATTDLVNAVLIVGNRYLITYVVSGRSAGTVTCKAGTTAGTARSEDGTYTDELSCEGSTSCIFTPSSDFDGSVTIVGVVNRSAASLTPAIGAALAQAVPTKMPWASTESINGLGSVQFANGDSLVSSAAKSAWKFLHDGSAFTHIVVWRSNTFPGHTILGQTVSSLSLASVGYGFHYNSAVSAFDLYVANGSGSAWAINDRFAAAPGAGIVFIATIRNDGSGGTSCWKNSTALSRTRYSGTPSYSSTDPNTSFTSGVGADALQLDQLIYNRWLTDAEVTRAGRYLATKWGITW